MSQRAHGTRSGYRAGCRCLPCRSANARYEHARVTGTLPPRSHVPRVRLGILVNAWQTKRWVRVLLGEGFTRRELARRLGIPSGQFALRRARVRLKTAAKIAKLYRDVMQG